MNEHTTVLHLYSLFSSLHSHLAIGYLKNAPISVIFTARQLADKEIQYILCI